MTANERKALRNELPGYAKRLPSAWDQVQASLKAREARSRRLDRLGTLLGIVVLGVSIPFIVGAFIWLIAP
jgi:hypothetical protein